MARCSIPTLPLSTLTLFSDWHPRAWEFTWLDLPAFLLDWLSGSAGQCYLFDDHLSDHTLQDPMLHFLAILSAIDPALSTSSVPRMLGIFWCDAHEINFGACAAQMFLIHTFTRMESALLLAMAFDHYLCTAPVHNCPDTHSASRHCWGYYNVPSPAHVAHSLPNPPFALLRGSNYWLLLLWTHRHCQAGLCQHSN